MFAATLIGHVFHLDSFILPVMRVSSVFVNVPLRLISSAARSRKFGRCWRKWMMSGVTLDTTRAFSPCYLPLFPWWFLEQRKFHFKKKIKNTWKLTGTWVSDPLPSHSHGSFRSVRSVELPEEPRQSCSRHTKPRSQNLPLVLVTFSHVIIPPFCFLPHLLVPAHYSSSRLFFIPSSLVFIQPRSRWMDGGPAR